MNWYNFLCRHFHLKGGGGRGAADYREKKDDCSIGPKPNEKTVLPKYLAGDVCPNCSFHVARSYVSGTPAAWCSSGLHVLGTRAFARLRLLYRFGVAKIMVPTTGAVAAIILHVIASPSDNSLLMRQ